MRELATRIVLASTIVLSWLAAASAQVCNFGAETWIAGCEASCTASWEGGDCPASCTSTPPAGQIIVNHRNIEISTNNGGFSVSRIASGQTFDYSRDVKRAYSYALDLAGQRGKDAVRARMQEDMRQAISEAERLSSSHEVVRLTVNASKHGSFLDRKRGWSRSRVEILVRCISPPDLQAQLLRRYGL